MTMRDLPSRLKRLFAPKAANPSGASRQTETAARQDRASTVAELQGAVSRLQGEIADLCRPGASADPKTLAALQTELDRTQRELARFQGRI